ncbi:sodium-coupled neutral amino acid transporter 7-like [Ruditapes philippinarum]|uniref:sodium-coupled neutral amino acid transporter 7-like n=1 Tax=Ruditapes philippinarum TaxID=129788 RepID=UPI00295B67FE|nr:sodium-coupled neutral amino acid transporter 7-like [Ruditapes philippinarum]
MSFHEGDINSTNDERKRLLSVQAEGEYDEVIIVHQKKTGSSWYSSVFLVVNAALGAGLLNFPEAYHEAGGVIVAIVVQAIFLVFIVAAIMILAYCSDMKGAATYQDVVSTVCGKNAQRASAMFLTTYCFGTCITFLIIIGDQWEEFFLFVAKDFYCQHHPWYMNRASTIVITSFLLILPLCFPKRIDFLKYASFVGVIGILYVVALVTIKYFLPHDPPGPIKTKPDAWMDVFHVVPTICFAYQCHVSIIPIYSCMEPRNLKQFSKTVSVAMFLCVATYTGTAAFGYLTFGDLITTDILLSYDPDPAVIIAVILIAVKTYTTYPILLFCGRAAFECLWTDLRGLSPEVIVSQEGRRRKITTVIWFIATLALAVFIPNIGIVIEILGAFAAVFIFIFPGMCMLVATLAQVQNTGQWTGRRKFFVAFSCCFITLGTFIFGLTLAQSIMNFTNGGIKADKSKYTC